MSLDFGVSIFFKNLQFHCFADNLLRRCEYMSFACNSKKSLISYHGLYKLM